MILGAIYEPPTNEKPWRLPKPKHKQRLAFFDLGAAPIKIYGLLSPNSFGIMLAYPLVLILGGSIYYALQHRKQERLELHKDPKFHTIISEADLDDLMRL